MKKVDKDINSFKKHVDSEFKKALKFEPSPIKNKLISDGYKRVLITGMSNSGKSFSLIKLFNLLHQPDSVSVYSSTVIKNIKVYETAMKQFPIEPKNIDQDVAVRKRIPYVSFLEECPSTDTLKQNAEAFNTMTHSIFIFDDVVKREMERKITGFFTFGRNFNVSPILLYQRYSHIPSTIRTNANLLLIFRSNTGYDQIWPDVKLFFDNTKRKFDALMSLLNKPEYRFEFISIDVENMSEPVKLSFTKNIIYTKISRDKYSVDIK